LLTAILSLISTAVLSLAIIDLQSRPSAKPL
jgi:hypothetical protein